MKTKTTVSQLFWGLFFLTGGGVLLASKMGWLTVTIGFWPWLFTLILAAATLKALANLEVATAVFALALLAMVWAGPLGIQRLVPWTLLGGALLISIGLSIIVAPWRRHRQRHVYVNGRSWRDTQVPPVESASYDGKDATVRVMVRMANAVRYVQTDQFESAEISVTMGDVKLYLDQAQMAGEQALVTINGTMGDVTLYLPREWRLDFKVSLLLGEYREKGATPTGTGPLLTVIGQFKMGDITVHYV
ncbi:LiaF transmembrane domain-containing protein [Lacticaseibacillus absianus]|uniref:LiaF transmembrane domain-containing protein n=1 Tax=Lacticaseibacillus absianus TaxID=2729623 RepID=UPI0015C92D58|nr:LiaF domain-containing protein [Lacticaseibacillus absianus]